MSGNKLSRFIFNFASSAMLSLAPILLIIVYAHLGTYEQSASLGLSLALAAPLFLMFSLQHGASILLGRVTPQEALEQRLGLAVLLLLSGACLGFFYSNLTVVLFFLYRLGDYLYEVKFYRSVVRDESRSLLLEGVIRLGVQAFAVACAWKYIGSNENAVLIALASVNILFSISILKSSGFRARFGVLGVRKADIHLGVGALVASVTINAPRYTAVAGDLVDYAAYSNLLSLVMGGTLLFAAVNNFLFSPYLSSSSFTVISYLRWIGMLVLAGFSVCIFFVAFCEPVAVSLIEIIMGERYGAYYPYLYGLSFFYVLLFLQGALNLLSIKLGLERSFLGATVILLFTVLTLSYFSSNDLLMLIFLVNLAYGLVLGSLLLGYRVCVK